MGKLSRVVVFGLGLSMGSAFAGPADVPVTFSATNLSTVVGQSVFVVGNIPQLGNAKPSASIKLAITNSCAGSICPWSVTIGIPGGINFSYWYLIRNDCALCYSNPANVVSSNAAVAATTPAGPPAPYVGKSFFYYSSWSSVSLYYSNNVVGWTNQPMIAVGPGRGGGEQIWRLDNVDTAGNTNLQFGFFTVIGGVTNYDNAGRPGLDYQSPLDACVVQDGQVYNYWPPASVSTNRIVTVSVTPTNGLAARTIRVYLPRGYNENATKRYPVLYMHDGQNLFLGMGPFGCWNSDINANNLIRFGKMRETIIVGVDNSSDRFCEYTPPGCTYSQCSTPHGDKYVSFLADQVKPYIDNTYSITAGRTLTDAENTGILGSSLGGLISAYMGWQRSATYHKIGAMSSSFAIGASSSCIPIPSPDTKRPIRMYLDSGDMDAQGTVGSSDNLLATVGERDNLIKNGYVFNNDLDHTIGYGHWHAEQWWDRRTPRCFTFLFPTSDEPNTVLDVATPPRITNLQLAGPSNVVTWTSYRLRTYTVQGVTNTEYSSSMTWSDLFTTTTPEALFWNYPSAGVSNTFNFLRVRESAVPNWPN